MSVRIGVIGAGIMGADHVSTLHRFVHGAVVTAVADVALDRARAAALEPGARPYDDAHTLIAAPDVDAVIVASHDSVHAGQVLAAVRAGKPVLCEKPLAPSLAEADRLVRELGTGGALLSLGFMRRFDPGYVQLRAAIDRGDIGAPVLVHNTSRGVASGPGTTSESSVTGAAVHEFDVVPWLLGSPVVEVSWAAPRASSRVTGLQDPQLISLRTADGVLSSVETFLNAGSGYVIRCEVVGETGSISLAEPVRVVVESDRTRSVGYAADWRPRFADAYRLELQAWVASVAAGEPTPLATARDGLVAGAVAEAVITSMREGGRTVKVEVP